MTDTTLVISWGGGGGDSVRLLHQLLPSAVKRIFVGSNQLLGARGARAAGEVRVGLVFAESPCRNLFP
jgi:hypothetical protein